MVYSAQMRKAVGAVRSVFDAHGFGRQNTAFREHGQHEASEEAPLVLVACSGGRDSLALALLAQVVAGMNGVRCGAVIVDHQMQEGSARVAQRAAKQCSSLGLSPVVVKTVDVDAHNGGGEAAARQARYTALTEEAHRLGAQAVLIAHTRDDQAETVLLSIVRGSSPSAVAGMPDSFVRQGVLFLRPLLDCTRDETTQICRQNALEWWDDPTNGDTPTDEDEDIAAAGSGALNVHDIPLRSQLRQRVLPVLKELGGAAVVDHLALIARSVRDDQNYLEALAHEELAKARVESLSDVQREQGVVEALRVEGLRASAAPIRLRSLRQMLDEHTIQPRRATIERIDDLVTSWHGQSPVKVSSEFSVKRQRHVIELCQDRTHANS